MLIMMTTVWNTGTIQRLKTIYRLETLIQTNQQRAPHEANISEGFSCFQETLLKNWA